MELENEPKPSMREIIEAEMKSGLERLKTEIGKTYDQNDSLDPTKTLDDVVYFNYFTHFPINLPNSKGEFTRSKEYLRRVLEKISGKSPEEFQQDILIAIQKSGVNKEALQEYLDKVSSQGIFPPANAKIYQELLVPIYLELREMGYSQFELCGNK